MAGPGSKPNKGETHSFQVTLPKRLYGYLGYLAQQSVIGVSENDVASYILLKNLDKMLREGFHKIDVPQPE